MNKLFTKITSLALGAAMMIGVGVAVGSKKVSSTYADTATMSYSGSTTGNMGAGNNASSVNLSSTDWTVTANKGGNNNYPGLNKSGYIAIYYNATESNSVVVSANNSTWTVTSITITFSGTYSNVKVYAGSGHAGTAISGSSGTYAINNRAFTLYNGNTSNVQVRISSIQITYTAGSSLIATTTSVSPSSKTITEGGSSQLTATVVNKTTSAVISGASVTWSSNNDAVASVAQDGTVTGVSAGTTTITATYNGDNTYAGSSGSASITVQAAPFVSKTYVQCTSTDDLEVDANYIITSGTSGTVKAMSTADNGNNRKVTDVTVSNSKISSTESTLVLKLGGEEDAWTFYTTNYLGTKGYFASSGSSNYLKVQSTAGEATIAFNNGAAVINLGPSTSNTLMRYNSGSTLFSCYASGQQAIYLWKEEVDLGNLTGISVKTAPDKLTYEENEYFDPTGLVITRTYERGSNIYSYANHENDFSFTPSLDTKLKTTDESVTISYSSKTTTQAITVNAGAVYTSIDVTGGTVNSGYKGEASVSCSAVVNGTGDPDQTVSWYITSDLTYAENTTVVGVATIDTSTGVITFLDNGTVYVWAYSQKGDIHNTTTATASASNLTDKPGSEGNPYTVAQARAAIDAGTGITSVYAYGVVTDINTPWSSQHSNISFDIQDKASDTVFLRAYRCGSGDDTDASTVEVGDSVVVSGNLTKYGDIYEFAQGCILKEHTKPSGHSVTISTDAISLSTDEIGEFGEITLTTAKYKKGVISAVSNADYELTGNVLSLTNVTGDVVITASVQDASVSSIELSGQTKKYAIGGTFSFDGTVTATWDDWADPQTKEDVESGYTVSGNVDTTTEGSYTVTVTYAGQNASYTVRVAEIFDSAKGEYHLLEENNLNVGDHIVIAAHDTTTGKDYSDKEMVMTSFADNNVRATNITVSNKGIISNDEAHNTDKDKVIDIELVEGFKANSFGLKVIRDDEDVFLRGGYAGSSGNNYLRTTDSKDSNEASFVFTCTDGHWTVLSQGESSNVRNTLQYNPNNNSPIFTCYASASQTEVKIYKFISYETEATEYAGKFLKANGSSFAGCSATISQWSSLKTAYGLLTNGAKALFAGEDHIPSETYSESTEISVKHAVCRYDDALIKHAELRGDNDFIGRINSGKLQLSINHNPIALFGENSTGTTVIIIISVIGVSALGGFFFLRKRKEI